MSSDHRLNKKIDQEAILKELNQLSGSELNSFLLKLFRNRANQLTPGDLKRQYQQNRFVQEAAVDSLEFKKLELRSLELAHKLGFEPVTISPLAPLGTCSATATVDQHKVVSSVRNTEVVSDLTNVLALKVATENSDEKGPVHYAATHRQVRAQAFDNPAFSAHFGLLGLVSGGFDTGNFAFELDQLFHHIHFHHQLIKQELKDREYYTQLMLKTSDHPFNDFLKARLVTEQFDVPVEVITDEEPGAYYQIIQFKTFVKLGEQDLNLSDGGLVDWTQKLIPNQKHRLFISATGIELVHKLKG